MKPRTTWLLATLCFALLLGAMAWTTRSLLGMERTQNRMAAEAAVQEKARLALWRMESIASALIIAESARPPQQYRLLSSPGTLFSNSLNSVVTRPDLASCSVLVTQPVPRVLLHFEMDQSGTLRSPQAPAGADREICVSNNWMAPARLSENDTRLQKLQSLLRKQVSAPPVQTLRDSLQRPADFTDNRSYVWSTNEPAPAADAVPAAPATITPVQQVQTWKPEEAAQRQSDLNTKEAATRSAITKNQVLQSRASFADSMNIAKKSAKPAEEEKSKMLLPAPAAAAAVPAAQNAEVQEAAADKAAAPAQAANVTVVSDFRALWLGPELLLTRRVSDGTRDWIQGAWIDWPQVHGELWQAVRGDFPGGSIAPLTGAAPAGSHLLASLPVQLVTGAITFAAAPFWSPLKVSLSVAWVCVLIGVAAVALMLRGMMVLSERRASFVSSVTHELRTPLATFKLYSEMLADGMVREEAKRQQYLETLTTEADRLGHLVENVLAYSRIERGKGPVTLSATTAGDLLHRIEPRLHQRTLMAGVDLSVHLPADLAAAALRTDSSAVEQVLFNLVDNACKYGRRDGTPAVITLHVSRDRRRMHFAVRDHGPGIDPREQRALFLPFHKSAREAAHSAPGVGLGLALCRRLAAELGGTLTIDPGWKDGASFVLTLPAA